MVEPTLTLVNFFPQEWPTMNTQLVFGVLLAARVRWLPTITGFMALGLIIGPSGLGVLSQGDLDSA